MKTCPRCSSVTFTAFPFPTSNKGFVCNQCGHTWGEKGHQHVSEQEEPEDMVNHPKHYKSGMKVEVECIMFTRNMSFDAGNAFKYVWRAGNKDDLAQDLEKAIWYIEDAMAYMDTTMRPELVCFLPAGCLSKWKHRALAALLSGDFEIALSFVTEQYNKVISDPFQVKRSRLIGAPSVDEQV